MSKWETVEHLTFVEVRPVDDSQPHYLGDECNCNPRIEKCFAPMLTPFGVQMIECNPVIVHHSFDGREKTKVSEPLQ